MPFLHPKIPSKYILELLPDAIESSSVLGIEELSSWFGEKKDLGKAYKAGADSIAIGHMLHYNKLNLRQIRDYALDTSIKVRKYAQW